MASWQGEDVDAHQFGQDDVPEEEMTAFLENTIDTFKAHRSEIEGLIKVYIVLLHRTL